MVLTGEKLKALLNRTTYCFAAHELYIGLSPIDGIDKSRKIGKIGKSNRKVQKRS
jgi:hypothetical protein